MPSSSDYTQAQPPILYLESPVRGDGRGFSESLHLARGLALKRK